MRSIALTSVAVPTVERGVGAHPLLVHDDRGGEAVQDVHLGRASVGMKPLDERAVGLVDRCHLRRWC